MVLLFQTRVCSILVVVKSHVNLTLQHIAQKVNKNGLLSEPHFDKRVKMIVKEMRRIA